MVLEHDDLILLARLLGNHLTGVKTPLTRIADKLLDYAERTGEFNPLSNTDLRPLPIEASDSRFYPNRLIIREVG